MRIAGVEVEDLEYENIGSWPFMLRFIILVIAILVALYLSYTFYLSDDVNNFLTAKNNRIQMQEQYETAYDQASNLDAYTKQVIDVKNMLASITQQIPRSSEQADLLDDIAQIAVSHALSLQSVKPGKEEYREFYYAQPLELFLVGTYPHLGEFVAEVSAMPRLVTVSDFDIKSDPKNPKQLQATLMAISYWTGNGPPAVAPANSTTLPTNTVPIPSGVAPATPLNAPVQPMNAPVPPSNSQVPPSSAPIPPSNAQVPPANAPVTPVNAPVNAPVNSKPTKPVGPPS